MSAKSVAQLFRVKPKQVPQHEGPTFTYTKVYTGVEIEAEGARWLKADAGRAVHAHAHDNREEAVTPLQAAGWSLKADNSLVNGVEFVFSEPLLGEDAATAIRALWENVSMPVSPRASVHVHVDWSGVTATYSLATLAALLYCIEGSIFNLVGEGRKNNNYCRPIETVPTDNLISLFADGADAMVSNKFLEGAVAANNKEYRYFGANFVSLSSFGTVEFRYFPSPTSAQDVITWVELCHCLRAAALGLATMEADVLHYLSDPANVKTVITTYFTKYDLAEKLLQGLDMEAATERMRVIALLCAAKASKPGRRPTFVLSRAMKKLITGMELPPSIRANIEHYLTLRGATGIDDDFLNNLRNTLPRPTPGRRTTTTF